LTIAAPFRLSNALKAVGPISGWLCFQSNERISQEGQDYLLLRERIISHDERSLKRVFVP
jgi:hypothetical protein